MLKRLPGAFERSLGGASAERATEIRKLLGDILS